MDRLGRLSQKIIVDLRIDTSCIIRRLIRFDMTVYQIEGRWLPRAGVEN